MKANGIVLYEGPSMLDGAPIVVIATNIEKASRNEKTGNMVQTWILRSDLSPVEAVKSGQDASICGACQHRGEGNGKGRSCYVNVFQAPLNIWKTWDRDSYPKALSLDDARKAGKGRMVRLGAYGDPAAVPSEIWEALTAEAKGWTGYTHQWRDPVASDLRRFCMASADSAEERQEAKDAGWRTFRVRSDVEALGKREIACPASDEGGNRTACEKCGLCAGLTRWAAKDIAIIVHGSKAKVNAYTKRVS
jgi:hypothetical protein